MGAWNISVWDGSSWDSDGTIPIPQLDMNEQVFSNQQKIILADGSKAFQSPEIKYSYEPLIFSWRYQDETVKNKITNYILDYDYLKVDTHISGKSFIGRFIEINPLWLVGQEPDAWHIDAIFEVME